MGAEENRELVRRMLEGLDVDALADDVQWTVPGTARFSGTYNGKQDMLARLMGPVMSELQGPGRLVIDNMFAGDDQVAVQAHAEDRVTHSGTPFNGDYCFIFRVKHGKISEVTEYADNELATKAFGPATAVTGAAPTV
jgi:ketosteroid isomerase-like protein